MKTNTENHSETFYNAILEKQYITYMNQEYILNRIFHDKKLMVENIFNAKGYIVTNAKTYKAILDRADGWDWLDLEEQREKQIA